jgi:hypothetical protein
MSSEMAKLLSKGSDLCTHAMAAIEQTQAKILRSNEQLARSRFLLRQHTKRRASSSLLPVIRQRLQDGRLPHESSPRIFGRPGGGGDLCDACGKLLLKKQLAMDIPSDDQVVVHLHANCYILWNAERHKVPVSDIA